jgi:hypothetical protein
MKTLSRTVVNTHKRLTPLKGMAFEGEILQIVGKYLKDAGLEAEI